MEDVDAIFGAREADMISILPLFETSTHQFFYCMVFDRQKKHTMAKSFDFFEHPHNERRVEDVEPQGTAFLHCSAQIQITIVCCC
jgi:hypothetical protein